MTIKDCAAAYQKLLNKKYIFTLEGNVSFTLEFSPAYFFHLLGLEKLTDIAQFRNAKPGKVFKDILSGKIPEQLVHNSHRYALISERVECFVHLPDMLHYDSSNKIIVDFDVNKLGFPSKLNNTKYILYKRIENNRVCHLTIGSKQKLYPETFIVENGSPYLSNQIMLDILDIKIIERKTKQK